MNSKIRRCLKCGIYTLKEVCDKCGEKTVMSIPPRFSPEDRYGKYRRIIIKNNEG